MDKVLRVGGVLADPTVKAVLEQFKEQIAGMQSGATWKEIASTQQAGAWTISGCTPGKPLFIILSPQRYDWSTCWIQVLSGATYVDQGFEGQPNSIYLIGGGEVWQSSNTLTLIPASSVVSLNLRLSGPATIHAYN